MRVPKAAGAAGPHAAGRSRLAPRSSSLRPMRIRPVKICDGVFAVFWEREACGGRHRAGASRRWRDPARLYRLTTLSSATAPRERVMILRTAKDELRGLPCLGSERRAPLAFFRVLLGVELGPGSRPARGQRRSRSALGLRFRVSRLGGARRVCARIWPGFSWMPVFCATPARPSGLRRASRADLLLVGFFRFCLKRGRARARASTQSLLAIGGYIERLVARTWSETPAFIYSFVRRPKARLGLGSDPRFSLLQALAGRSKLLRW